MKYSFILLSAVAQTAFAEGLFGRQAQCNADNCLRAVRGTNGYPSLPSKSADCSSFQRVTVTPATSTTTITIASGASAIPDVTSAPAKRALAERQVTNVPSAVPTYASFCLGTARYESACSCIGIPRTTTTASAPVATTTVTVPAFSYVSCANIGKACSTNGDCFCYQAAHGGGVCGDPLGACNDNCAADADCAEGSVCLQGEYCDNGSTCTSADEVETCAKGGSFERMMRAFVKAKRMEMGERFQRYAAAHP